MGLFVDSKILYKQFKSLCREKYFVDKSKIIIELNKLLNATENSVCITKPRKFGKSSIAALIVAYYSKSKKEEFKEIFDELNISGNNKNKISSIEDSDEDKEKLKLEYEKSMGKYHTIYINFSKDLYEYENIYEYLSSIQIKIIDELKKIFKVSNENEEYLSSVLTYLFDKEDEEFIFVIDDWDYMFNNNVFTEEERKYFISFLRNLLKDRGYIAFTYMTGMSPIEKIEAYPDLDFFKEFSMISDEQYYQYFGFTKEEVEYLCTLTNGSIKYEELDHWYNGYTSNNITLFNPYSILLTLYKKKINNYWTKINFMREIGYYIIMSYYEIEKDFLQLIKGERIEIKIEGYNKDNKRIEFFSEMIIYGFFAYDNNKIYIPNKELLEVFNDLLKNENGLSIYTKLRNDSKELLEATLIKDTDKVCKIMKKVHLEKANMKEFYNPTTLEFIVKIAYFDAQNTYDIKKKSTGKKKVDFIFYPKDIENGTSIILEIKIGKSAKEAIKRIHDRQYYNEIREKGYEGEVLLVGINCTKRKEYTCIIEEYKDNINYQNQNDIDNDNNNNKKQNDFNGRNNPNKRKNKNDNHNHNKKEKKN